MFRRFFTRHGAVSPAARFEAQPTRRPRRNRPCLEDLEGRRLLSLGHLVQLDASSSTTTIEYSAVGANSGNPDGLGVSVWVQQYSTFYGLRGPTQIDAQLFDANTGTKVGPEIVVVNSPAGKDAYAPSVSMNYNGDFVVSFTQQQPSGNTFVVAQAFNNQGAATTGFVQVGVGTFYQYSSAVAMDNQGNFVVTYVRDTNDDNPDVFAKDYDSNGDLYETITVAASSAIEETPSIAMDDEGNFDIAYQVVSGSRDVVYLARYSEADALLGGAPTEITTGSSSDFLPSVSMNEAYSVVSYDEAIGSNSYAVDASLIYNAQGAKPTKVLIADTGQGFGPTSVAIEPFGDSDTFVVAYQQYASVGTESLYVAEVGPNHTVTSNTLVGFNDYYESISSLQSETGEFGLTYISDSTSPEHVYGVTGTY